MTERHWLGGLPSETPPAITVGPSTEGRSMDKLRDLANGERKHISITDARAIVSLFEEMRVKVGSLAVQLDMQYGTPCAQIRWQEEREKLLEALEDLFVNRDSGVQVIFGGNPIACDALEAKCRAAIAKARGQ